MSQTTRKELYGVNWRAILTQTSLRPHAYTGENVPMLGQVCVAVQSGNQAAQLPILVVAGYGSSLQDAIG